MVQAIAIAILTKDVDKIKALCSEDVVWSIAGSDTYRNHDKIENAVKALSSSELSEIKIDTAIAHGKKGAAYAMGRYDGSTIFVQANIIEFQSAKGNVISKITTIETVN